MANYDFKSIEKKWQDRWEKEGTFRAIDDFSLPKFYGLIEFPYPSGAGMHVGHIKAYSGMEVICRKRRMQGYNVLFPIGFDAFGLPAENYAIKTGTHPRIVTDQNIHNFTGQLKRVGFAFDWSRVIDTTDTDYYKWTQWIFLTMFEHGLVYPRQGVRQLLARAANACSPARTRRAASAISATAKLYKSQRTSGS
jgi:Leucyl-tRNA synthetase